MKKGADVAPTEDAIEGSASYLDVGRHNNEVWRDCRKGNSFPVMNSLALSIHRSSMREVADELSSSLPSLSNKEAERTIFY